MKSLKGKLSTSLLKPTDVLQRCCTLYMAVYYLCAVIALIGNLIGYKRFLRLLLMIIYFLSLWEFFIDGPLG